ncbi:aminoglycoside phosphotransferase family protein [Catalinimonas sp. 4WD22]|uniref:phosphotransferase enzyme family protein n=1 Tax=Catalinimonas locisalis TaxID=3133978 RepID=UPI0031017029
MSQKSSEADNIRKIISQFSIGDGIYSYKPFGSGHINDTYLIYSDKAESASKDAGFQDKFLLQRINHEVFKDVEGLMQNMHLVTSELKEKLSLAKQEIFTTVSIITTYQGKLYYRDDQGNYWRIQTFIPNSISYDTVASEKQAYEAGYAFGMFQLLLSDMDVSSLKETIPDFHNMEYRFSNLEKAIQQDVAGRKTSVTDEINFAMQRKESLESLYKKVRSGDVPIRITHNDTKFNNVLLDQETQKAICIIDLDTVMPGVAWYDFGDSIRTIVNTAEEDEADVDKIEVDMSYFRAFTQGYLQETAPFLTTLEVDQLAFSSQYMTFIMGLRFLTDYISGDVYYKIKHKQQNLQRVRAQFRLVSRMEKKAEEMQDIVWQTFHHYQDQASSSKV